MSILLNEDTTFIVQGITGREAVNLTRECLDYGKGAKVVGGVTPGRKGREVHGVPVFDTVREITAKRKVDGTVITVPAAFALDAALEAVDAGIKLIVIITEGIPRRDASAMIEYASLHGARIIGPNCLGVIIPDVCRFGSLGGPAVDCRKAFKPGVVGVMSRSGGMTTEICNALSAAGLGESTAISIGGDPVIGSTYAELMPLFEADPATKAIVIYSEPGGASEAELARWATENKSRLPIVAFVAGRFMDDMPGMSFGHAGTIVEKKLDSPADKIRRMRAAGISVADEIGDIPRLVKERISGAAAAGA
jgi:succinyl-CoA synthetase alpha subunit